ncbi:MAG: ABC transporter permease [Rhodothermales bacterium]
MLKNYLIIALRNLNRHRGYSALNVVGLSVGIAAAMLIGRYVQHERSYDRFHERSERVYRLVTEMGTFGTMATAFAQAGVYFRDQIPGVVDAVRLHRQETVLRRAGALQSEPRFFYADPSFFEVFSYPLIAGDPATALVAPRSVILTASTAQRYFGDADPLGRTLEQADGEVLTVTGIVADPPTNTHLHFDLLASFSSLRQTDGEGRPEQLSSYTYLLLAPDADLDAIQARMDAFSETDPEQVAAVLGMALRGMRFHLQPLVDIHLHSALRGEAEANSEARLPFLFGLVAIVLIAIAMINYMNLATARALQRSREVGVRKVVGAGRAQLMGQFMGEALVLSALSVGLACLLAQLAAPLFNQLTDRELAGGLFSGPRAWGMLAGFTLLIGLLAGWYPALHLSAFQPMSVLKGRSRGGGGQVRRALVAVQFTMSIVLIVVTLVIGRQVRFIQTKDPGYEIEQLLSIPMQGPLTAQADVFRAALSEVPGVASVSNAFGMPLDGGIISTKTIGDQQALLHYLKVDERYFATVGMRVVAGRGFRAEGDSTALLLNETAARLFGVQDRVGEVLDEASFPGQTLIGIVSDFHLASLHAPIEPAVFEKPGDWRSMFFPGTFVVRLAPGADVAGALAAMRAVWQAFVDDRPFTYTFADAAWASRHRDETRLGDLTRSFALLALFIACLGLFGLAAFTAEQRTKEIGIRKVLGASVAGLVRLLTADVLKLVGISSLVAAPIALVLMQHWLGEFAYRIDLGADVFLLAGGGALAIAFLTVAWQAVRAAVADPVKSLRYE